MDEIPDEIRPGLAPGSVVFRFHAPCSGRLIAEHRLPPFPHVAGCVEYTPRRGEEGPPILAVYDGDDGELMTVIVAMTFNLRALIREAMTDMVSMN